MAAGAEAVEATPCPFILGEPLGRGGQGTTYRATDPRTGADPRRVVAVKRFRLAEAADWKRYDLFVRECQTLQALNHPGIPRFLEAGGDHAAGELWLAMELAEGESLAEWMRQRRALPAAEVVAIARALCQVLGYLHGLMPPVIHRDLKPANVMVAPMPDGGLRVALVDFGSVRNVLRPEGGSTVVGTFGYFAPEQLHGAASAASDLYALGVTIAAIASGLEATALPRAGLAIDVPAVIPSTIPALRRFVHALTRPEPSERPVSAAAAAALLDAPGVVPARAPEVLPDTRAPLPAPFLPEGGPVLWLARLPIFVVLWFLRMVVLTARRGMPEYYRRKRQHVIARAQRSGDRQVAAAYLERVHRQEARAQERLERARDRLERARLRLRGAPAQDPGRPRRLGHRR